MSDTTTQSVLFPTLISKPIVAAFDQSHSSTDGGGLLLKGTDERLGLSKKLASCLRDGRDPGKSDTMSRNSSVRECSPSHSDTPTATMIGSSPMIRSTR